MKWIKKLFKKEEIEKPKEKHMYSGFSKKFLIKDESIEIADPVNALLFQKDALIGIGKASISKVGVNEDGDIECVIEDLTLMNLVEPYNSSYGFRIQLNGIGVIESTNIWKYNFFAACEDVELDKFESFKCNTNNITTHIIER